MDEQQMRAAFEDVVDQALCFHAYADHLRDYDLFVYVHPGMAGAFPPRWLRYRFTHCVRATVTTAVGGDVWARSLGDELLDPDCTAEGYVWGVRWQVLYPGIRLVPGTRETRRWQRRLGVPVHEARVGTNGHDLSLVFSDLRVDEMEVGAAPFVVD